jgi:hypothetical protein
MLSEREDVRCLVDVDDYDWLSQWRWNRWYRSGGHWQVYAKRNVGPARSTVRMHREIMQRVDPRPPIEAGGLVVDHRNGQTLDNRRANLRWLTGVENLATARRRETILSVEFVASRLVAQWHQEPSQAWREPMATAAAAPF